MKEVPSIRALSLLSQETRTLLWCPCLPQAATWCEEVSRPRSQHQVCYPSSVQDSEELPWDPSCPVRPTGRTVLGASQDTCCPVGCWWPPLQPWGKAVCKQKEEEGQDFENQNKLDHSLNVMMRSKLRDPLRRPLYLFIKYSVITLGYYVGADFQRLPHIPPYDSSTVVWELTPPGGQGYPIPPASD